MLEEIDRTRFQIEELKRKGDFNKVAELQYGKLPELERKLKEAQAKEQKKSADGGRPQLLRTTVGAEEIAEVVARATGIPVVQADAGRARQAAADGSQAARARRRPGRGDRRGRRTRSAARARACRIRTGRPARSCSSGPTGVGKTELCKALAEFLFDSEDHLIRLDMSEFMEKHSVARMIGAPPGYVGYDEGGYLTEAVRRKPYSVLLLDEVEKAHPDVFNVLLQVLDDGRLTDGQGRTVDFKNTVIVMTSNLGSQQIMQMVGQPYAAINDAVWAEVKKHFRPEFLNRIDEAVVFHALDQKNIEAIAKIQLRVLEERLAKMDMKLEVTSRAPGQLAKAGFDPVFGARPLKRAIQRDIENPLSKLILEGRFGPKDVIPVDYDDGRFVFDRVVH